MRSADGSSTYDLPSRDMRPLQKEEKMHGNIVERWDKMPHQIFIFIYLFIFYTGAALKIIRYTANKDIVILGNLTG